MEPKILPDHFCGATSVLSPATNKVEGKMCQVTSQAVVSRVDQESQGVTGLQARMLYIAAMLLEPAPKSLRF